ncbi:sugar transferase [Thiomonas bhubaneswarensis]|uniref:Sugar transferase involved in LPS biosynthesis (Colanic, teichoic acid) n=1 Tax=Thiomonas bhubaneswarensis TaxID=339866 RepID=A0A0K6IA73_9BURK|nr:sugar transferase [Thiomonas bhubaneswarensis]CUB00207.1 Sugar transferase involved in LPS biosynthesis (colanic, teichoic acid) [Thiomonas bhubaneswarensis]
MAKRLFDIVLALLALLLLSPVMLAAALAVWLDSGRPVLFAQTRVGRGTQPFQLYKFRSMVVDAPRLGSHSTAQNDPRITRVGRILRRSSVDELPQLFNVLRGDMSLVGPRPDVPAQRGNYTEEQWALRHRVRPGITGLAQALYRSRATPQQRLQADLDYAQHHGLLVDLRIIGLTVLQLFRRSAN